MARRPARESAEDKALRELDAEDEAVIDRLALEAGPPADSERLSEAEEDEFYAFADPLVDADHDAFAQQLMTNGLDEQTLPNLMVLKAHPEWAELYGQPTQDAERADLLARLAHYPFRWSLLIDLPDPEEQARKAETLDRRFQKAHGARMSEPLPVVPPVQPPAQPSMPQMAAPEMPTMPQQPAPAAPPPMRQMGA